MPKATAESTQAGPKMATHSTTTSTDLKAPLPLTNTKSARWKPQSKAIRTTKAHMKSLSETIKDSASKNESAAPLDKIDLLPNAAQGKEDTVIDSNVN